MGIGWLALGGTTIKRGKVSYLKGKIRRPVSVVGLQKVINETSHKIRNHVGNLERDGKVLNLQI